MLPRTVVSGHFLTPGSASLHPGLLTFNPCGVGFVLKSIVVGEFAFAITYQNFGAKRLWLLEFDKDVENRNFCRDTA
jgi:hypothetical protein